MFWKKSKSYFDYFEEQAHFIHAAAKLLQQIFENPDSAQKLRLEIRRIEHEADMLAHQAYNQMNTSSFILPIDREDILALLKILDDIIDCIDDSAEAYTEIYELSEGTVFAKRFAKNILWGSELVIATSSLIRKPAKHGESILANCVEIHRIENEGDLIKKEALQSLFGQMKAGEIEFHYYIAWSDIYNNLEKVSDLIEDFADLAEQLVMKYS